MQLQVAKLFTQLQASPSWDANQITDIVPERYLWRALQFQQFVKDTPEVFVGDGFMHMLKLFYFSLFVLLLSFFFLNCLDRTFRILLKSWVKSRVHVVFLYFCYLYFQVHDPNLMRKPTPDPYAFYIASYESAAALFNDLMVTIIEWLLLPVTCYLIL